MLFYFLHNYFKYKTLFTIHSMFFNHIFREGQPSARGGLVPPDPPGISAHGQKSDPDTASTPDFSLTRIAVY